MPRVKESAVKRRKMPACLTCLIVCLAVIVVLVVGAIVATNVIFNKTVSPMIGGVKLNECIKLINGALKSNREKIVTEEFSENDLNDFYLSLNSMLYQKDMTDEEYQSRYDALSEEEKAKYGSLDAYKEAHPYRIDLELLSSVMNLDELLNQSNNENPDVSASGEANDNSSDDENQDDSLNELFKKLAFDFYSLKDYPYESEYEDYKYTSFQITGKQISAVINEIVSVVFGNFDLSGIAPQLEGANISSYAGIPQVIAKEEKYDDNGVEKSKAKLIVTVELKIRDLVKESVAPTLVEQGVPEFAVNIIGSLLPKDFFVTLETYPTDKNGEATLRINNYNDKMTANLKTIVNALAKNNGFTLFPDEQQSQNEDVNNPDDNGEIEQPLDEDVNVFNELNAKIADIFSKINESVPVEFVSDETGSMTLRISHIQGFLKMIGLFDPEDVENSVTPHMFLTTISCMLSDADADSNREELTSLYEQIEEKYGIDKSYWEENDLMNTETLENITDQIDLNDVTFKTNVDMRVYVREGQLTALLDDALKNGLFDKASDEVSAAEDDNSTNDLLDKFTFEKINIDDIDTDSVENYYYLNENNIAVTLYKGKKITYTLSATLSVAFADLLDNSEDDSENPLLDTLKDALPQKLSLAVVITVVEYYDNDNNFFHRVIGAEVGKTSFRFNSFNDYYSDKVLNVLKIIIEKTSGSSNQLDTLTTQIEDGFAQVFDNVRKSLNCDIMLSATDPNSNLSDSAGCLVLPSVYELVRGASIKQVEENENLCDEDLLTLNEIRDLFVQVYNPNIYVVVDGQQPSYPDSYDKIITKFDKNEGNNFLARLSAKYYMKTALTAEKLFSDEGLNMSADNFDFNGANGLYKDNTSISDLDVSISGGELASVIDDSGKLSSVITTDDNDFIESLNVLTCTYSWINEKLYLNFEFEAKLKVKSSENNSLDISSLLPKKAYVTASIELYNTDGGDLYNTDILLNNGELTNLIKLVKLFSDSAFSDETISDQVKNSVKDAFDSVKQNVNFKYTINDENNAVTFKNIFNTLNKLSHKNDESYEENEADDIELRSLLKEFGRAPSYVSHVDTDEGKEYIVVTEIDDLTYFTADSDTIYGINDATAFFNDLNRNYYIAEDKKLTYEKLKNLESVDSDLIDFGELYADERDISAMTVYLTSNRLTALANKILGDINIDKSSDNGVAAAGENEQSVASAKIIQSRIKSLDGVNTLETVILAIISSDDELLSNLLPSHVFVTAMVDLSAVDEYGNKTYETKVFINNFDENETQDLFDRIDNLENSLGTDFGFDINSLKDVLHDQVQDLFDNNMNMFGELKIRNGYIDLPNVFEYITGGSLENGKYDQSKPLFETCRLSSTKGTYGIDENGIVGYNDGASFISLYKTAVRNYDGIWGYYDDAEEFVAIQTLPEDLMHNLRVFGNKPVEDLITIEATDNLGYEVLDFDNSVKTKKYEAGKRITAYGEIGIYLQDANDGFYFWDDAKGYYVDYQSQFFDNLNKNYYITEDSRKINSDSLNEDTVFVIDNTLFDFNELYGDQRKYDDLKVVANGSVFASLANKFNEGGFSVSDSDKAQIVQMHIFTKEKTDNENMLINGYTTLRTLIKVELSKESNASDILPDYIYMVCFTVIDPDASEQERFTTEFVINDFGYKYVSPSDYNGISGQISETEKFIDRLNVIKNSFGLDYDFDLDDAKVKIQDKFRELFDKNLSSFGSIRYEDDTMIIPNIFEYMTDGQLIKDNETRDLVYVTGEDHYMLEKDGTRTDPEILRERFKALGKGKDYDEKESIVARNNDLYNDNAFTDDDLQNFYSDVQAYYFLRNLPTSNDFTGGNSYFEDLTGANFDTVFNLTGLDSDIQGTKGNYLRSGLYNYNGNQVVLKLSDRALAGLINEQSSIVTDDEMKVNSVKVTSLKLDYVDENNMTIVITIKVESSASNSSMPSVFYLTTITERTIKAGEIEYNTKIAVNSIYPEELDNFLSNMHHVEEYSKTGIIENLTVDRISTAVEDALRDTLDGKLKDYTTGYGKYEQSEDKGSGYIGFPNIYSEILEKTGATVGDETDMQNVIYKLNNANQTLVKNKYSSSDALTSIFNLDYITDKQFGYALNSLLKLDADNRYITVEQVVIFKGINDLYAEYENIIENIDSSFKFGADDSGYYMVTLSVSSSNVECSMSLAPDVIYITILIDQAGNLVKYGSGENIKTIKFVQDFTESEQALFISIFADDNAKLDVDETIENKVKSVMAYVKDTTLHQYTDFSEYYGYVGSKS